MTSAPDEIDEQLLKHCIQIYTEVITKAYEQRIKDVKKRAGAMERDTWRYEQLPKDLAGKRPLSITELERLVQWKITHGPSRPFLPAMIRKNDGKAVLEATEATAKSLASMPSNPTMSQALDVTLSAMNTISKLSGVGPATASLVLAVYSPRIPFFQDELWAWLFPEKAGGKLKYDRKEYEMLFRKCWEVWERAGKGVDMVALEKASFVLQHIDLVPENHLGPLTREGKTEKDTGLKKASKQLDEKIQPDKSHVTGSSKAHNKRAAPKVGAAQEATPDEGTRRSKRSKK